MQGRAKIVPPFRFGIVEAGVYRGAYPTLKNFPYLKTLGLTTVISLTPEPPTVDLEDFCVINNINLQHYMVEKPKDDVSMSIQDVTHVIQTIIRPSKLPVYIHCLDGADVTGAVICCLRRLQAWYKDSVDSEFLRYSRTGEMSVEKLVASFKEVEISEEDPPPWLWPNSSKMHTHPFIKLIKHHQGVVVQVVRPAPQDVRKKDSKTQVLRQHQALSAMKRPRKMTEKRKQTSDESQNVAHGVQGGEEDSAYDGAWQVAGSNNRALERQESDDMATVSEEDEDEDDLDRVYPGLLEALSLHNFSDQRRSKRGDPSRGPA